MNRATLPLCPWDKHRITEADLIGHPSTRAPAHIQNLILHTFQGKVGSQDMQYMAKAILQMADEIFELRKRISVIEGRKESLNQ